MGGNKTQIIYRLDNINADDGVDIFEIAPILMSFGELIKGANEVLGYDQKINVKVKPFKEGSWITEFIIQQEAITTLFNYAQTSQGQAVGLIMGLLGLNAVELTKGVVGIVRFTKGKVNNFKRNNETSITYYNDNGESIEVSLPEHALVQSPIIQINMYNSVVAPLDKFPTAGSVSVGLADMDEKTTITDEDKESFTVYANTELLEEVEENVTKMSGIYVKPKRGSYSGEHKAYSFYFGESVLYPTTIEDADFLAKLQSGDIRPFHEDVLKVDIEIRQKKDISNRLLNHYSITKLIEYIEYQKPMQIRLNTKDDEV